MSLIGKKAPAVSLNDQDGTKHRLSEYAGHWVLLYFYPKDNTPGCTIEAQMFKKHLAAFRKRDVAVLGVSRDDEASKKKFCTKYGLTFPLLADKNLTVAIKYGVLKEKTMFGRKVIGIMRESFLIDPTGRVAKHYTRVQPLTHPKQVLEDLRLLQK